jgi:hypothetical protein
VKDADVPSFFPDLKWSVSCIGFIAPVVLTPGIEGTRVMNRLQATEMVVLLQRRRERDQAQQRIAFSGYDIFWPDGTPVSVGLRRFCQQGTRLLLGRARDLERALIKISLHPVAGLEAALTRPGPGVRCRRFYALRLHDAIRLHFFTGTPTEVVFNRRKDDPEVLRWLQSDHMRHGEPFWFDLASKLLVEECAAAS